MMRWPTRSLRGLNRLASLAIAASASRAAMPASSSSFDRVSPLTTVRPWTTKRVPSPSATAAGARVVAHAWPAATIPIIANAASAKNRARHAPRAHFIEPLSPARPALVAASGPNG